MSDIDTHTLPSDFLCGISALSFASMLACWARNSSAIFLVASFQAWFASFSWTFNAFLSFTASFSFWMTVGSWRGVLTLSASSAAFLGCVFAFLLRVRGRGRSSVGSEVAFVWGGMMDVKMTLWDVFRLGVKMARYNVSMEHSDHFKFELCNFLGSSPILFLSS